MVKIGQYLSTTEQNKAQKLCAWLMGCNEPAILYVIMFM